VPGTCFTSIRAFTPNGDGINELFIISCAETINNQLQIYNRWNQLVFTANNYRNNWNGIDNKGFLLPDGTIIGY
jgi:gliding motility-associated-like protein